MIQRRFIPLFAIAAILVFVFMYHSTAIKETWRGLPQKVGMGENATSKPSSQNGESYGSEDINMNNPKLSFKAGVSKPAGYNFSMILVVPRTMDEDVKWIETEVPSLKTAIYVADDPNAPLHPPKNKGHEVMIYLSWIIDNYDNLPDVSIFMHAHRWTWHNNDILNLDSSEMLKRLSPWRVWREGYMNLRCSWMPGCPDWMHPGETEEDANRPEQTLLAQSWSELFPLDPIPNVLAQPCCAQFALSSERIRTIPQARYKFYRDWLLRTQLPDHLSGRIWEYVWQFVFTGQNIHCPEEFICYCDGYGVCFGGKKGYDDYQNVRNTQRHWEGKLNDWIGKGKAIEEAKKEGRLKEAEQMEKPEPGKDKEYEVEIKKYREQADELRSKAIKRGEDPRLRAEDVGREWKEGDGY
jgi:hypothetical protein